MWQKPKIFLKITQKVVLFCTRGQVLYRTKKPIIVQNVENRKTFSHKFLGKRDLESLITAYYFTELTTAEAISATLTLIDGRAIFL